ncbi:MAG: SDR family NAD(P)-dependent oxidoreductase [Pseudomonadota bacterium]|jgi:NAD(P)-dependent dehydrogenase (short-subunit alcohol dehydrogenase family)|nr:3-hydroxyacyl-CoA dehydrogenase [Nisaea sp.]MDP7380782.1 SDR family NAD(P)-dependent oxidoreductase [Alphaproteobacteria bacterium]MEC7123853.1 SDR family NAD(P)-dependent oxidoreductase [Pseudomonadota bacterium]MEC7513942.1 SDR family NAD(P)-dependent oxidoreductase [Pseudomonadota bacterium]MEC7570488.1 SDR family NAD(P)-dependent oxidoreductase [Pseudomonadota bacterium]|tara:strand:- start:316 stop:1236 length:921 start_codon:yes stop_codon:yes gene_type:complete
MSEGKLLDGKTALITGAGRGIGRDMAIMMAANGAKVIVNDLGGTTSGEGADQEPALEVVKEIRDAGGEAEANFGSVADFATGEAMVAQAIDQFGGLDIVVNNAGILRDVIFHKMTEEEWDAVINVHLKGAFNVSRAAATHFREKGSGCFVHFTSTSGLIGNFGQANYAAAKLGIAGLSKSIALDMARFGVTSNCISPFAWSRMIGTIPIGDEAQRARVDKLKAMTPAKIAPLAVALASEAGKQVSGQIFAVRNNEIFLMGQSRPVRSVHTAEGWTPEGVVDTVFPSLQASFFPLDRSADIFTWDPI